MRRMARLAKISILGIFFVVVLFSIASAQLKAAPVDREKLEKPIVIPLPDLVVTGIYGLRCPDCTMGRTNYGNHPVVEYLEDIQVHVKNQGRAASGPCTLRIELYDVVRGRRVINKSVPALNSGRSITVEEHGEFLFRRAEGIRATIDSTGVVTESNEANNSMKVIDCVVYFI